MSKRCNIRSVSGVINLSCFIRIWNDRRRTSELLMLFKGSVDAILLPGVVAMDGGALGRLSFQLN